MKRLSVNHVLNSIVNSIKLKVLFLHGMYAHKSTLYITFDGLSDPLGQSQILPYLCGVSKNGYQITIISCEKKKRLEQEQAKILALIKPYSIQWKYIIYDENGGFISRLRYIKQIKTLAFDLHKKKSYSLIHCRSYLASLIGLQFKLKLKIPFLFDMRGFWADERIDGGIWKKENALQKLFYSYFKRKEKQFLNHANAIVSLTHAGVEELSKLHGEGLIKPKTIVIPCCTNTHLFKPENLSIRTTGIQGISEKDEVLVYSGSIGTWYYTKEMIDCVLAWKQKIPNLKLLILTKDEEALNQILHNYSKEEQQMIVSTSASYQEMPKYLSIAKAAIFFIKPAYSKIASSPTKMAECWSMNLPIITNSGIGDNDLYFNKHQGGILIDEFTEADYQKALTQYLALKEQKINYRAIALNYFDTQMAVEKYTEIYNSLIK